MTENKTNTKTLMDMFEEKKRQGVAKREDVKRVKLEKPGDMLIGLYLMADEMLDSKTQKPFSVYYLRTEEGRVTFSGGVGLDRILSDTGLIGKLLQITFVNKEEMPGGRAYNNYEVFSMEVPPELEELFA